MNKPFDLEAAKRGEPIQCCGVSAKFVAHEPEAAPYEQFIYLAHGNQLFTADANGGGSHHNLTMAPKRRTVWLNLYPRRGSIAYYYDSEEEADGFANDRIRIGGKAYPVEIEE